MVRWWLGSGQAFWPLEHAFWAAAADSQEPAPPPGLCHAGRHWVAAVGPPHGQGCSRRRSLPAPPAGSSAPVGAIVGGVLGGVGKAA